MINDCCINICGIESPAIQLQGEQLNGLALYEKAQFRYFGCAFAGCEFVAVEQADDTSVLTPAKWRQLFDRLEPVFGKTLVALISTRDYIFRKRMLEQGVCFVVPGQYAFLPNFVAQGYSPKGKPRKCKTLQPVAQSILLKYLQRDGVDERSFLQTLAGQTGYSYVSVARAATELEQKGLCSIVMNGSAKTVVFDSDRKALWQKASPVLKSPVLKVVYMDEVLPQGSYPVCDINALAHYSWLCRDEVASVAVWERDFRDVPWKGRVNEIDGLQRVEIWSYPPGSGEYVDRLSLSLTLEEDEDPRVQQELERMMEEMVW